MSFLRSVIQMTCPRCRRGQLFINPMKFSKPLEMHERCSICGQKFEPELGFYYGAMFISYVFIAFISLLIAGTSVFLLKLSVEVSFTILIAFLVLIFFWNLRLSRSIWIHVIVKYDPRFKNPDEH